MGQGIPGSGLASPTIRHRPPLQSTVCIAKSESENDSEPVDGMVATPQAASEHVLRLMIKLTGAICRFG